jgi:hypothetical protein
MKEPLRVTAVKGHEISTYRLSSGRYMTVWYDSDGGRQRRSRATLKEADELAQDVSRALQEKVNGVEALLKEISGVPVKQQCTRSAAIVLL